MIKNSIKKIFFITLSITTINVVYADTLTTSNNYFQPRAFSANLAREMLMEPAQHKDINSWYTQFSATAAYQSSWSQSMTTDNGVTLAESVNGLGMYPFWSGTNSMIVSSSTYANAHSNAPFNVDAYQFGLGQVTTPGAITLDPKIYQSGADFMFIFASSAHEPCFFAKIKAPMGVYNINPQLTETIAGSAAPYPTGALILSFDTPTPKPASTMKQAFAGILPGGQRSEGNFTPMQYGLIDGDISTGVRFGDIEVTAGYRYISDQDNVVSVGARGAFATGGKATGVYVLEPIFGRGGNFAFGAYLDGHIKFWENNNGSSIAMKVMANAQHLFTTNTMRSFDLTANGPGSKYLLVANYANNNYQTQIQNLINYTTLACNSSFAIEADAVIDFAFMHHGFSFDIGYEYWGRSCESLVITGDFANRSYAILGNQGPGIAGLGYGNVPSYACQPLAQINIASTPQSGTVVTNPGPAVAQGDVVLATSPVNRIALADLNVSAAQQAASMTSKVFSKISFEWIDRDYCPHVGIMGEIEFSNSNNNALAQWGLSVIGGVSF